MVSSLWERVGDKPGLFCLLKLISQRATMKSVQIVINFTIKTVLCPLKSHFIEDGHIILDIA